MEKWSSKLWDSETVRAGEESASTWGIREVADFVSDQRSSLICGSAVAVNGHLRCLPSAHWEAVRVILRVSHRVCARSTTHLISCLLTVVPSIFSWKWASACKWKQVGKLRTHPLLEKDLRGQYMDLGELRGQFLTLKLWGSNHRFQIPSPQNGGYWFIHSCKFSEILEIKIVHTLWSYLKHSYSSLYYLSCSSKPSTSFSIKTTVSFGWYKLQLCYCKLITCYHQEEPTT